MDGLIAQVVEQEPLKFRVAGSSPAKAYKEVGLEHPDKSFLKKIATLVPIGIPESLLEPATDKEFNEWLGDGYSPGTNSTLLKGGAYWSRGETYISLNYSGCWRQDDYINHSMGFRVVCIIGNKRL